MSRCQSVKRNQTYHSPTNDANTLMYVDLPPISIIRSQQMQASLCLQLQLVSWSRRTWLVGPKGFSFERAQCG